MSTPTDKPGDDAAVIGRSTADPEQFSVIFRRHAPAILRYVRRRIGTDAADDVAAETFLVAFRQRDRYCADYRDALPWLYGIATNLAGRHWRTEVRQLRLLARTGIDPAAEPFTDRIDAAVSAGSAKARLAGALARLPAGQRDALLLVAWGRPDLRPGCHGNQDSARHRPVARKPGTQAAPAGAWRS